MLLNLVEFLAMNNPLRAFYQRHREGPLLLKMGGPLKGARTLEIGCGRGVGVGIILDLFGADSVDAFDLDPRMIARARVRLSEHGDKVKLWVGDATHITAEDREYDAVFDFGIIHHIPEWRKALAEVHRVLKPGGRFYAEEILRDVILHPVWRRILDHPLEDRFDHAQFIAGLNQAGLTVTDDKGSGKKIGWYVGEKR